MRKFLGLVLLSSAVSWTAPLGASACSCAEQPFETAHAGAAAIFEGRAASIAPQEDGRLLVTFDVVQTWRAAGHEHVEVLTQALEATCGYPFEIGTSYLVYAAEAEGDRYLVSLCSRTAPMAAADSDRVLLGSGVVPVDVVDSPESDRAPVSHPPTHAGCASCSAGGGRSPLGTLAFGLLAIGLFLRRSRS